MQNSLSQQYFSHKFQNLISGLFLLCSVLVFSQIFISENAIVSVKDSAFIHKVQKEVSKSKIYILAGTKTHHLIENTSGEITFISEKKSNSFLISANAKKKSITVNHHNSANQNKRDVKSKSTQTFNTDKYQNTLINRAFTEKTAIVSHYNSNKQSLFKRINFNSFCFKTDNTILKGCSSNNEYIFLLYTAFKTRPPPLLDKIL